MAALIKTNSDLAGGGLQLVNFSVQQQTDLTIGIDVEFICLPAFANNYVQQFRAGAGLPDVVRFNTKIIDLIRSLNPVNSPTVRSCTAQTQYGLTKIVVVFAAEIAQAVVSNDTDTTTTDGGFVIPTTPDGLLDPNTPISSTTATPTSEVTISTDLRSFSGSQTYTTSTGQQTFSLQFDYYAMTVVVEGDGRGPEPLVSKAYNIRGDIFRVPVTTFTATTYRIYRNNLGVYKQQRTSTINYIQV